jgi:hypothetical protein
VEPSERQRQRRETERGLAKLEHADWDETSEVAARTAARLVRHMSKADSDAPSTALVAWHRRRAVRVGGGIVATVVTVLASIWAALARIGTFE